MLASADRSQLPVPSHVTSLPVTPPRGSENSFPPGITSLEMWGNTAVEFGKFKDRESASIDNIKWMRAHRLAAHQVTTANQNMIGTSVHKVAHQFSADCGTSEHTGGTSVHTAEQNISQSTQAAHQYTRRNISAQSGTWLNWLTDRQCISALDTTELSIHWLTETEWTKDLNFKCSDVTHKWNHDSCTYN